MRINSLLNNIYLLTVIKENTCSNLNRNMNIKESKNSLFSCSSDSFSDESINELEHSQNSSESIAEYIEKCSKHTYLQQITDTTKIDSAFKQNVILFLVEKAITFVLNNNEAVGSVINQFYFLREMDNGYIIYELITETFYFIITLSEFLACNDIAQADSEELEFSIQRDIEESLRYICLIGNIRVENIDSCNLPELKEKFINGVLVFKDAQQETFYSKCLNMLVGLKETIVEAGIEIDDYMIFLDLCKILVDLSTYLAFAFAEERDVIYGYIKTITGFFNYDGLNQNIYFLSFAFCVEYLFHMFEIGFFPNSEVKINDNIGISNQKFQVVRLIGVLYGIQQIFNNNNTRNIPFLTLKAVDNEVLQVIQTCQDTFKSNDLLLAEAISSNELNQESIKSLAACYREYLKNTVELFSNMECLQVKINSA